MASLVASHSCTFLSIGSSFKKNNAVAICTTDERIATQRRCHEKQMPVLNKKNYKCRLLLFAVKIFLLLLPCSLHAQENTDTVIASDTGVIITPPLNNAESETDESDGEKHIYDTSQYFFNWKDTYADAYRSNAVQQRHLTDSAANAMKKDDDFWYINSVQNATAEYVKTHSHSDSATGIQQKNKPDEVVTKTDESNEIVFEPQRWLLNVIWIVAVSIFVCGIIYFLITNKINLFAKKDKSVAEIQAEDDELINIFQLPYSDLLKKAYTEKNYRLAVRILYLQTLKLLSEKSIINFQHDYTNLDYLSQVRPTTYYNDFFKITRHYEYVWYGKFDIQENAFNIIHNDFKNIQNKIS